MFRWFYVKKTLKIIIIIKKLWLNTTISFKTKIYLPSDWQKIFLII